MVIIIGMAFSLSLSYFFKILTSWCPGFFGQLSGNGLITYFLPILLKNAGKDCLSVLMCWANVNTTPRHFIAAQATCFKFCQLGYILVGSSKIFHDACLDSRFLSMGGKSDSSA
jgi:hypothetical protein